MGAQSIKRNYWMALFEEKAQLPDMTVRQFCISRNVSEKSYWYFHKRLADEMEEKLELGNRFPGFLEVRNEDLRCDRVSDQERSSDIVEISSSNITVRLSETISDQFLLRIMRALNNV